MVPAPPTKKPRVRRTSILTDEIYVLGLDLSLTSTGYAILKVESGTPSLVETGHITTSQEQKIGERLSIIERELDLVLQRYPHLHSVAKEAGFSRFNNVTSLLNQVLGICVLTVHKNGFEVTGSYPPKTVKKQVTGNGNATKEAVAIEVRKILNIPPEFEFANMDESDAAATALSHLYKTKLLPNPHGV